MQRAVTNLVTIVRALEGVGAAHIFVAGMPKLGLTPSYNLNPARAAQANAVTAAFNAALRARLPHGTMYFDAAGFMQKVVDNPAAYGLTNGTDPCVTEDSVCTNPDEYLFLNDFHPTTAGHRILADQFAFVGISEPGSLVLVAAGLGGVAIMRHVRRSRSSSRPFPLPGRSPTLSGEESGRDH